MNPSATARPVGGIFFPQRLHLKLDSHAYSPKVLHKFMTTAGHVKSFELAAQLVKLNAEIEISGRHLNRLVEMIGVELAACRDQQTGNYVHHRRQTPTEAAPKKVAVGLDGGRINTREPGHGRGVHEPGWREDKIGCFQVLEGPSFTADPHPEPPKCFLDPDHVKQIAKGFVEQKGVRGYDEPEAEVEPTVPETMTEPVNDQSATDRIELGESVVEALGRPNQRIMAPGAGPQESSTAEAKVVWPPKRVQRTCVASIAKSQEFGKMLAAEAQARNFFAAKERSFLGDGLAYNWRIQQKWFGDFTPILDFIHALSYVYLTAKAVTPSVDETWQRYVRWMTECWQGRVSLVIAEMRDERRKLHERLGEPTGKLSATDPREVVRRTLNYLENNAARMNYPEYRQRGLAVTTAAVESLVKEFNYRVKGTEKFWNNPGGTEPILQVRAAVLSEDDRLEKYLSNRPGCAFRRRPPPQTQEVKMAA
jgi:hypothetical protein